MSTVTHVLDTSALLAHFFDEPGADVVQGLWAALRDLTVCLPVDRAVAELACHIRAAVTRRLPLVDALIAATARSAGAILVHKDPHMAGIPAGVVKQLKL
jgi:predicted nucleic acid-binding protein